MNNQAFSKIWMVVILIVFIAGGILIWQYWGIPKEKIKLPEEIIPVEKERFIEDETSRWSIYRNVEIGIEFKYPGVHGVHEHTEDFIDEQIGPIYVKAFPSGWWGPHSIDVFLGETELEREKNEKYYKDIFSLIKDYQQNQECNSLDIYIPIYESMNLGKSCRIVISDSGVKMITGFYKNIHGAPPKVAFFITNKYWIELILHYYDEELEGIEIKDLNSDSFIQEIQMGKYENVSKRIEVFDQILKTVKIIK